MINTSFSSPWYWQAIYNDGSVVSINDTMPLNVDREKLSEFQICLNGHIHSAFDFQKDMRLILLYRTQQEMTESGEMVGEPYKIIIVGWQSTVNGKNVKSIFELHPSGLMIIRNFDKGRKEI